MDFVLHPYNKGLTRVVAYCEGSLFKRTPFMKMYFFAFPGMIITTIEKNMCKTIYPYFKVMHALNYAMFCKPYSINTHNCVHITYVMHNYVYSTTFVLLACMKMQHISHYFHHLYLLVNVVLRCPTLSILLFY